MLVRPMLLLVNIHVNKFSMLINNTIEMYRIRTLWAPLKVDLLGYMENTQHTKKSAISKGNSNYFQDDWGLFLLMSTKILLGY